MKVTQKMKGVVVIVKSIEKGESYKRANNWQESGKSRHLFRQREVKS
jgi:hypothetical protein